MSSTVSSSRPSSPSRAKSSTPSKASAPSKSQTRPSSSSPTRTSPTAPQDRATPSRPEPTATSGVASLTQNLAGNFSARPPAPDTIQAASASRSTGEEPAIKALPSAPLKTQQQRVDEIIQEHKRNFPDHGLTPAQKFRKDAERLAQGAGEAVDAVRKKGFGAIGVQVGPFYGETTLDKNGLKLDGGTKGTLPVGQLGPVKVEIERKHKVGKPSELTVNGTAGPVTAKGGLNSEGKPVGGIDRKKQGEFGIGVPGLKVYLKGGLKDAGEE